MDFKLSGRLAAAASFVRPGSAVADIGTDHAYLPVWLVKNGAASRALAADINDGPLRKALANIAERGAENVSVARADGLAGIESFAPDDIVVAGMGGELIRDIIAASEYAKREGVRLILQPMTKPERLREYLLGAGFNIADETLVRESGRIFQVMCCEYDGVSRGYSPLELLAGKKNLERGGETVEKLLERLAEIVGERAEGKRRAGGFDAAGITEDDGILCEIANYLTRSTG